MMSSSAPSPSTITLLEPGLHLGRHFLFVDEAQAKLTPHLATLRERHGGWVLPLWDQGYRAGSREVQARRMLGADLLCLWADRDYYREAMDTVRLVVVDPGRPSEDVALELELQGETFRRRTVHLDQGGLAVVELPHLPVGRYRARCEGAAANFEVTGPGLVSWTACFAGATRDGTGLTCLLDITWFGLPFQGRVEVIVTHDGLPVFGPDVLDVVDGHFEATFPIAADEGLVAHLTCVDRRAPDLQVPLRPLHQRLHETIDLANVGAHWRASTHGAPGSKPVKGLCIECTPGLDAPLRLVDPVGMSARFEVVAPLDHVVISTLHPTTRRIQHRRLSRATRGQVVEAPVGAPFGVVAVGGFHKGCPWEGLVTVLTPADLGVDLVVSTPQVVGQPLSLRLTGSRAGARTSAVVIVRDVRAQTAETLDHQLAGATARAVDTIMTGIPRGGEADRARLVGARRMRLGQVLVLAGLITESQVQEALSSQKISGRRLGEVLVAKGLVTEKDIASALAQQLGIPFVDLAEYPTDLSAARLVPRELAERHLVLPVHKFARQLTVALSDPTNRNAQEDIERTTGLSVKPLVSTPAEIREALRALWGSERVEAMPTSPAPAPAFVSATYPDPWDSFPSVHEVQVVGFTDSCELLVPWSGPGRALEVEVLAVQNGDWTTLRRRVTRPRSKLSTSIPLAGRSHKQIDRFRLVLPGEHIEADQIGAQSLWVQADPRQALKQRCVETVGWTAPDALSQSTRLLAAVLGYPLASGDSERAIFESAAAAASETLESLWVRGDGLQLAAGEGQLDAALARFVMHTLAAVMRRGEGGSWPGSMVPVFALVTHLRNETHEVHPGYVGHGRLEDPADAYQASLNGSIDSGPLAEFLDRTIPAQWNAGDAIGGSIGEAATTVREQAALGAATLIRSSTTDGFRKGLALADRVGATEDLHPECSGPRETAAVLQLLAELERLGVATTVGGPGTVIVDDEAIELTAAAARTSSVAKVEAVTFPAMVLARHDVEWNWSESGEDLDIEATWSESPTPGVGDRLTLNIKAPDRWPGDQVAVGLPATLAVADGGRVSHSLVKLVGLDETVAIPVTVVDGPRPGEAPWPVQAHVQRRSSYQPGRLGRATALTLTVHPPRA